MQSRGSGADELHAAGQLGKINRIREALPKPTAVMYQIRG